MGGSMRGLVALVVGLGILILAGFAVIVVTVVHRMNGASTAPLADVVLAEPAGTHIASASLAGGRVVAVLQGGGADRIVVVDLASGRRVGRVVLGGP